jgi:hypothetical protein
MFIEGSRLNYSGCNTKVNCMKVTSVMKVGSYQIFQEQGNI